MIIAIALWLSVNSTVSYAYAFSSRAREAGDVEISASIAIVHAAFAAMAWVLV